MTKQRQIIRLSIIIISAIALFFGGRELYYFRSIQRYPLVVEMDWPTLVKEADVIIRGTVEKSIGTSRYTDDSDELTVATRWKINVTESIKGDAPTLLIVRTLGGRYGLTEFWAEDEATFTPGEEVLLYLDRDADGADYRVVGMFQGHFTVRGEKLIQQETGTKQPLKEVQNFTQVE
ncbi:MAG: hypothetical protein V1838_01500 [Patescibacteria group bacterium]